MGVRFCAPEALALIEYRLPRDPTVSLLYSPYGSRWVTYGTALTLETSALGVGTGKRIDASRRLGRTKLRLGVSLAAVILLAPQRLLEIKEVG